MRIGLLQGMILVVCICALMTGCVGRAGVSEPISEASGPFDVTPDEAATPSPFPSPTPVMTEEPATPLPEPTFTPAPTATPGPPPRIVGSYPIHGDEAVSPDHALVIEFDMPMDPGSTEAALSISPTVPGEVRWASDKRLTFVPDGGWPANEGGYEVVLSVAAHSAQGTPLSEPFSLHFDLGGRGMPIPVLMYHRISVLPDDATALQRTWTVSPDAFAEQMRYLAREGWHSIFPAQIDAYFAQGEPLPIRPVVISMDDGYRDVYTTARPIFIETDLRPVLFVIPEYAGGGYAAYLDWPMLQELVADGFGIGAHSWDHSDLRTVADSGLPRQIVESRAVLEEHLGITVDAFCYPYGSFDERVLQALADAGYTTAFTLNPGAYQPPASPYLLNRLLVTYETTLAEFADLLP
ncbi:MAG TPA: polysaccharide deacetylase family protein [Chloroflexi bacterium]|nr:polysaccharide deacetylase family protein [Chloroflexota bacterium]